MLGCPIRKSADQWSFAPTRSLSQLITSFIACESLGIRHTPFYTFARTELACASSVDYTFSFFFTTSYNYVYDAEIRFTFCFRYQYVKERFGLLSPEVETRGLGPQCRAGPRLSCISFTETRDLQHL